MREVVRRTGEDPLAFAARLHEGMGETRRVATLRGPEAAQLAPGAAPEAPIEAAFRFLPDREPKESIFARFDLSTISRYFPAFERLLADYLWERSREFLRL